METEALDTVSWHCARTFAIAKSFSRTQPREAETNLVAGMLFLFYSIIIEGLVIAGSGFLPEDWDEFIENSLYPSYTPTVLLFLSLSTAYGLWKIGKLPLPFLGGPPPKEEQQ